MDKDESSMTEKITIDFDYFIQLTIRKEMPWKTLVFMLTDLTTTLDRSKQVIKVLVQELEKLASKVEQKSNQEDVHIERNAESSIESYNNLKHFDFLVSEDESLVSDIDNVDEVLNYEHEAEIVESKPEFNQNRHSKEEVDFHADQFYEFIGNNEKPTSVFSDDEKVELSKDEANLDYENDQIEKQEKHETIYTKEKSFVCKLCSKSFAKRQALEQHERIHSGEKPFECKLCQKQFNHKGTLKRHETIHAGGKPYQCKLCSKMFAQKRILKDHEIIHSKPFQCKTCLNGFLKPCLLKYHENVHKDEKPYKCKTCEKCFYSPHILQRHEKKA